MFGDTEDDGTMQDDRRVAFRPVLMGTHGMISSGHPLVSSIGFDILKKGGNAIDAGIAALFAACVAEHTHHSLGGETAILIYSARTHKVHAVNGAGPAPALATREYFEKLGRIPDEDSILIAPVPGALDGMILALDRFGTLNLEKVIRPAIDLAEKGFPVDHLMAKWIQDSKEILAKWPSSKRAFLPNGQAPQPGAIFLQPEYAATLKRIVAAERKNAKRGRTAGLRAARDVFYKGDIARAISRFCEDNGGLIRYEDLAKYTAKIAQPMRTAYEDYDVHTCGTWTQGPMVLQVLNLLEGFPLGLAGHNSPQYIHLLTEAVKLAYADRHHYYGDPDVVRVPTNGLLSKTYAAQRRTLIRPGKAMLQVPIGDPWKYEREAVNPARVRTLSTAIATAGPETETDTTSLVVIDAAGNMFATTSSNNMGIRRSGVVPGDLGFVLSGRLRQFSLDPTNPNVIAPGKIPRITLSPSLILRNGNPFLVLGTPGEDVQTQAIVQVLFNIVHFSMDCQRAVEAARFRSLHGPASEFPQSPQPGQLRVEPRISAHTIRALEEMGHAVAVEPDWHERNGGVVAVLRDDQETSVLSAGADPRRSCYAAGW